MMRYLLDSNIISEPVRPHPDLQVQKRYHEHQQEAAMSSVVWHELVYGLERMTAGKRKDYLFNYLTEVVYPALPMLPYDEVAAAWHARERARLESLGRPRPLADGMIAAVAATRNLILVTRNTTDFLDFEGLHVENWFEV